MNSSINAKLVELRKSSLQSAKQKYSKVVRLDSHRFLVSYSSSSISFEIPDNSIQWIGAPLQTTLLIKSKTICLDSKGKFRQLAILRLFKLLAQVRANRSNTAASNSKVLLSLNASPKLSKSYPVWDSRKLQSSFRAVEEPDKSKLNFLTASVPILLLNSL